MAELRIEFSDSGTAALKANMEKAARRTRAAIMAIAQAAAEEIKTRGVADIQAAGKYGSDWTSGLHVTAEEEGDGAIVRTTHTKPYYSFLNRGGPIKGNPLLWIPTEHVDGHIPASEYGGKLVSVMSKTGIPLLIDPNVESSGTGWRTGEVMYIGEKFVVMPQKFHILEIIRDVAKGLKSKYKIAYSTAR